ncbi:MAG: sugar phosphate isomerase/epimerase [Clostridia bacterium]|nr:sugar phosphate isomerase/epimerase [Clostridia bacterium]
MKLGVLTVLLSEKPIEEVFQYLNELGVNTVELGTGGYPGNAHLDPDLLLNNDEEIEKFLKLLDQYGMEISGLSCHGNPVHPNLEIAKSFHEDFEKTVLLAEKLGIDTVIGFSGCPGDSPSSKYPNWVTCPWPEDFTEILDYQWNDVLIPYWKDAAKFAKNHGIRKIALEMHPGFCVYNPQSLLKLRKAVGDIIGSNFDPSHLFWQGIDPVKAIRELKDCIFHFHAKDTKVCPVNTPVNGVLDIKPYSDEINRSWVFRTVGYGHDLSVWKDIFSTLQMIGYEGAISIEHEDSLMSVDEGLRKAIAFLRQAMIVEKSGELWWV